MKLLLCKIKCTSAKSCNNSGEMEDEHFFWNTTYINSPDLETQKLPSEAESYDVLRLKVTNVTSSAW